jgi:hypothetical protein
MTLFAALTSSRFSVKNEAKCSTLHHLAAFLVLCVHRLPAFDFAE